MNDVNQDERTVSPDLEPPVASASPFSALRHIRIDEALARFGGDRERFKHWLNEFTQYGPLAASEIREAIGNGSPEAAAKLAHALKGRTGMLGMSELHSISQTLELALRNNDPPEMWLEELETTIDEMRQQIESAFGPKAG